MDNNLFGELLLGRMDFIYLEQVDLIICRMQIALCLTAASFLMTHC